MGNGAGMVPTPQANRPWNLCVCVALVLQVQ